MRLRFMVPLLGASAIVYGCFGFGDGTEMPATVSEPVFTLDAGTTWTSLYRDYFGPSGVASCAGDGNCHGGTGPNDKGYLNSGYLCPDDGGAEACWQGMTNTGDGGILIIAPGKPFSQDFLQRVLCKVDSGVGIMPLNCTYRFSTTDMTRIGDWVNAGAQYN